MPQLPRGIRNNNPLNIVHSKAAWQGRAATQTDPTFVQFATMRYGIRAALMQLRTYITKHNCNTIADIIARWCPDDTAKAYALAVSQRTGIALLTPIEAGDRQTIIRLAKAMAEVETGFTCMESSLYLKPSDFDAAWCML